MWCQERGRAGEQRVTINVPTDGGKHKKPFPKTCMAGQRQGAEKWGHCGATSLSPASRDLIAAHLGRAARGSRMSRHAQSRNIACRLRGRGSRGGGNLTAAGAGAAGSGARRGGSTPPARGGGGRGPLSREYGKHVRITCGRLPPAAARGPSEGGAGPRSAARRRVRGHFKRPPGATALPCPARSMR